MRRTRRRVAQLAFASALATSAVRAEDVRELRHDVAIDVGVTVTGAGLWELSELGKGAFATHCVWCDRDDRGSDTLNGLDASVRSALKWRNTSVADTASSVLAFGVAPVSALGLSGLAAANASPRGGFGVDALVIVEATVLAADANQLVKFLVRRERPYAHFGDGRGKPDEHVSFFSGHTTLSFALATSSGMVASMRGYELAPVIWPVGLAIATGAGYLRIAADRHYFTDVLGGAIVGSLFGVLVPVLFHSARSAETATAGVPPAAPATMSVTLPW